MTALLPENLQFGTDRFSIHSFYFIGADSTQVFFTAHNARKVFQAYVVPITGGEAKQINSKLASGGNVVDLWEEPTSKQLVYLADQSKDEVFGLYSVPPQGGDPVTLTEGQDNLRVIDRNQQLAITPDGKMVVFMLYGSSRARIYSVASTGGTPTPISELAQNLRGFRLSPDGTWVVYSWGGLFQIEPNGSEKPYKINDGVTNFAFSPDGKWVYSMIISKGNTMSSLPFPAKPGDKPISLAPEELNIRTSAAGGFAYLASLDSQYVVTLVTDKDRIPALYSAAVDGKTPPVQLNAAPGSTGFAPKASITADSSTVVYINDEEAAKTGDLYAVPIAGGKATRLTTDDSKGVVSLQVFPPGANWTFNAGQ
ncbi:MAG: PD40 domain-containing protein [Anaerolineae bacterium]|nr:PD40 domain-containing protein [Anaerolineae bacterium]